jgi:hypothetical protein
MRRMEDQCIHYPCSEQGSGTGKLVIMRLLLQFAQTEKAITGVFSPRQSLRASPSPVEEVPKDPLLTDVRTMQGGSTVTKPH